MKIPQGRQANLLTFVVLKHENQVRKYTGEPYHFHLRNVADMADDKCRMGYEIGLCHDLLEDTQCTPTELVNALIRFKYSPDEVSVICSAVNELTDVYTHEDFPQLNRAKRKKAEAERLHKISYEAQTVKYCDLIDNTSSIVQHDKHFAKVFLNEASTILGGMNKGNPVMFLRCHRTLKKANKILNEE
jgi:(p)ppGpp synthase/HD superfamily hydrolase